VEYTLAGMDVLLHRIGWSVQVPARRAAERVWAITLFPRGFDQVIPQALALFLF
jgi:hypothetical protein